MFGDPQINFYVQDVEASTRFYRDAFGFTEMFRTPKQCRPIHAEVRLDQLTLGFAALDVAREMHRITAGTGPSAELVVWTDDVDRVYADLAARDVRTLSAPHDFLDSLRAAWVAYRDGSPVQIVMRRTPSTP